MNDPESIEISCVHGRLSFLKGMSILSLLIGMERRKSVERKCGEELKEFLSLQSQETTFMGE